MVVLGGEEHDVGRELEVEIVVNRGDRERVDVRDPVATVRDSLIAGQDVIEEADERHAAVAEVDGPNDDA